jgi:pimeloyl-ACP methyl ester carboxylesterase
VSARHLSNDISSYGGDATIVATRAEIDRVMAELGGIAGWLRSQVDLEDFLVETIPRIRLALELPPILEKLEHIRNACATAADAYFGQEAEISRELRENPELPIKNIATGFAGGAVMLGLLTETPVTASFVSIENYVEPPKSIAELSRRLDGVGDIANGWIRIEKFIEPASPVNAATGQTQVQQARYVVYIPGTQAWGPATGTNPLDLTSDLSAIAKPGFAGSEKAVSAAMQKAGIGADSKVLFVGHSQGGIVAANISTRFAGSKVLSFGSPLGQLGSQLKAETIAVEHVADVVPLLDGKPNPASANLVTVRQEVKGVWPGEQHEMAGYRKTAEAIDQAPADSQPNSGFARIRREISDFAGTSQGQALYFELERVRG